MKVLFIGSNPSTSSPDDTAFHESTVSGKTLRRWVKDIPVHKMYMNLYTSKTPNNSRIGINHRHLESLLERIAMTRADRVVAVGNDARAAILALEIDFYHLPHPSGLNRQCNDKNFIESKIKGLKSYILEP